MEKKQILAIISSIIVIIFIALLLTQTTNKTINQTIEYSDFTITKTITFNLGNRIEDYSLKTNNPIIIYLLLPKELNKNNELEKIVIIGDYQTEFINEKKLIKLTPNEYNPGTKKIQITFPDTNNKLTSIIFAIPLINYETLNQEQKNELNEEIKNIQENSSTENYYINESQKIMQEFANKQTQAGLRKNNENTQQNNQQIFFSEEETLNIQNLITNISDVIKKKESEQQPTNTIEYNTNNNETTNTITPDTTNNNTTKANLTGRNFAQTIINNMNSSLTNNQNQNILETNETNFSMIVSFKSEPKKIPEKIVIPFNPTNNITIWNGEFETTREDDTEKKFLFEVTEGNNNAINFEYELIEETDSTLKYVFSFVVNTEQINDSFATIKGIIKEDSFAPKIMPIEISLIRNLCETRVNQYTEFENKEQADYLEQKEIYNAIDCHLGLAGLILGSFEKPNQNWIGREEQISSKILYELDLNEEEKKSIKEEQTSKRNNYYQDFLNANKLLDSNLQSIIQSAQELTYSNNTLLQKIEDKNIFNELLSKQIFNEIELEEKKFLLDPTDYNTFKKLTEKKIEFYLINDKNASEEDKNNLRQMIYANNYIEFGAWDSETIFFELSNTKYSLEQDIYGAMKTLANKMNKEFKSRSLACPDSSYYDDVFEPYSEKFDNPMYKSFREVILYIGISKGLITEKEAINKLKQHLEKYCHTITNPTIEFTFNISKGYELERERVNELIKDYIGLKLVMNLAYDVSKTKETIEKKYGPTKTDINYYPEWLNFKEAKNGYTIQEIFLADETKIGQMTNTNYDPKMDYSMTQIIKDILQTTFFGSLKPKITTIEHYKFRPTINNMNDAQELAGQLATFDNIATTEYSKIASLKEKEKQLESWNYFIVNLFRNTDKSKLTSTQNEITFRIDAIRGITQIQNLLLDGNTLPQIEQGIAEWEQKPDFDSEDNDARVKEKYELAKKSGTRSDFLNTTQSEALLGENAISSYAEDVNRSHVPVAMLLTPVRTEYKKFYTAQANKVKNKTQIENAKTLEETEELIMPKEYQAKLLLENANYYYSESQYATAVQIYGDIKAYYKETTAAKKAEEQLKKFSSWRMLFSKPYWETFGNSGAEFLTIKNIAKYMAFVGVIKYVVAPQIVQFSMTSKVQKAYALKTTSATTQKALMTPLQSRIAQIKTSLAPLKIGTVNTLKKIHDSKLYKIMTYDITGTSSYNKWIEGIAKKAVLKESEAINSQLKVLTKLSETPLDEMSSTQLTQVKNVMSDLTRNHNLLTNNQFDSATSILDDAINNAKNLESSISVPSGTGPIIDVEPIIQQPQAITLYNSTQAMPISLAKTTQLSPTINTGEIIFPVGEKLQMMIAAEKEAQIAQIMRTQKNQLAWVEKRISNIEKQLELVKKSSDAMKASELLFLEGELAELEKMSNFLKGEDFVVEEMSIACSHCGIDLIVRGANGETQNLAKQKEAIINGGLLKVSTATIDGLPAKEIIVKEHVVGELLDKRVLFASKLSDGKIQLDVFYPAGTGVNSGLQYDFGEIPINIMPPQQNQTVYDLPTASTKIDAVMNFEDKTSEPHQFRIRDTIFPSEKFGSMRDNQITLGYKDWLKDVTIYIGQTKTGIIPEIFIKRTNIPASQVDMASLKLVQSGPDKLTFQVDLPEKTKLYFFSYSDYSKITDYSKINPIVKEEVAIIDELDSMSRLDAYCKEGCEIILPSNDTITAKPKSSINTGVIKQGALGTEVDLARVESITIQPKIELGSDLTTINIDDQIAMNTDLLKITSRNLEEAKNEINLITGREIKVNLVKPTSNQLFSDELYKISKYNNTGSQYLKEHVREGEALIQLGASEVTVIDATQTGAKVFVNGKPANIAPLNNTPINTNLTINQQIGGIVEEIEPFRTDNRLIFGRTGTAAKVDVVVQDAPVISIGYDEKSQLFSAQSGSRAKQGIYPAKIITTQGEEIIIPNIPLDEYGNSILSERKAIYFGEGIKEGTVGTLEIEGEKYVIQKNSHGELNALKISNETSLSFYKDTIRIGRPSTSGFTDFLAGGEKTPRLTLSKNNEGEIILKSHSREGVRDNAILKKASGETIEIENGKFELRFPTDDTVAQDFVSKEYLIGEKDTIFVGGRAVQIHAAEEGIRVTDLTTQLGQTKLNQINFTCHSPCIWDNGSPIKVIDPTDEQIKITGNFSEINKLNTVEYSPEIVATEGIAQALQGAPNLGPTLVTQVETAMKQGKTIATIQASSSGQEIVVYAPEKQPISINNENELIQGSLIDDSPLSIQGLPKIDLSPEESFGACCSTAIPDALETFHSNNNSVFANYPKFDSAKGWLLSGTNNDARRMRTIIEMWDKGIEYVLYYKVENGRFVTNPTDKAIDSFLNNVMNGNINQQTIENNILNNLENKALDPNSIQRYKDSLSTFFTFMRGATKPALVNAPITSEFSALALNSAGTITPNIQKAIEYGYTLVHKDGPYKVFVHPIVSNYLNAPRNSLFEEFSYHIGFYDPESEALFVTNTITERDFIRYRVEFDWGDETVKYYDDFGIKLRTLIDEYNRINSAQTLESIRAHLEILKQQNILDTTTSKIGRAFAQGDPNWPNLLAQVDSVSSTVQTARTDTFRKYVESILKQGEYICGTHHTHPETKLNYLAPSFGDACHYSYETKQLLAKPNTPNFFETIASIFNGGRNTVPRAPFSYNTISGDDGHIPLIVGEKTCIGINKYWENSEKIRHAFYPNNAPPIIAQVYAR